MKKLLLLTILGVSSMHAAKEMSMEMPEKGSVKSLIEFTTLARSQKNDWLDYSQQFASTKMKLIQNHANQMFDQKLMGLEKLNKGEQWDPADCLKKHEALYESQVKDWKNWHDGQVAKADSLMEKHDKAYSDWKETQDQ